MTVYVSPLKQAASASSRQALAQGLGQASISPEDFAQLAAILHRASGIALPPSKTGLVVSRLSKRLRELGDPDFSAYIQRVRSDDAERLVMVSALTTNVTGFFREAHHFDMLAKTVLPPLIASARRGARLRLWSAACSTGEEPYSLAMTLIDLCPEAGDLDIRILATDIDPAARAVAEQGIYSEKACDGLSQEQLRKHMLPREDRHFAVTPQVQRMVTFNALNLIADWPMSGKFDVILCRNVVIYFNAETRARLWARLAEKMPSGGFLFIGHSERLDTASEVHFDNVGLTTYRRR